MTISAYSVLKDFNAPKINLRQNEMQAYRLLQEGNEIIGYVDGSTGKQLLIIENKYAVPVSILKFEHDVEIDGVPVAAGNSGSGSNSKGNSSNSNSSNSNNNSGSGKSNTNSENISSKPLTEQEQRKAQAERNVRANKTIVIPKEYQEQMDKIKNTNMVSSIVNKSRNSVNGMLIGAAAGFLAALLFKQSKFGGVVLGATAGGLIGYKITGDEKKKQDEPAKKEVIIEKK